MTLIDRVSSYSEQYSLSDLHVHADRPMSIRVNGEILSFPDDIVSADELSTFIDSYLNTDQLKESFLRQRDADLAIQIKGNRYRANFFHTSTGQALVMRKIENENKNHYVLINNLSSLISYQIWFNIKVMY